MSTHFVIELKFTNVTKKIEKHFFNLCKISDWNNCNVRIYLFLNLMLNSLLNVVKNQ